MPTLTVCLIAAAFMKRFKESRLLQNALYGIRPVCIGMIAAVIIDLSMSNYTGTLLGISWVAVLIGVVAFCAMFFLKWNVAKTILLSAVLGLALGGFA